MMLPPQQVHHEPSFSPAPPQVLLEDLTLVIDVALLVAFATAVHLLRQKLITVATLAHALSVAFLVFTAGHYIERHVIGLEGVEDLVSRRGPGRGGRGRWWLASWPTAGMLSIGAVMALVARFWSCKGEGGGCVAGGEDPLHNRCKMTRLRFYSPVFTATVVFVYLCISSRLNALLGGSVLHPRGGGYALAALASPAVLATICVSGCASVWLYAVLVEEQAAGGDTDQYQPETIVGAFGAASTTKQQRRAKTHTRADEPAWAASYLNRGEKGGHAQQQRRSPNRHRDNGLYRQDSLPSSSPRSSLLLGAGGSESDFEASSSSFLFGGGQPVGGGGAAAFGVVGSTASPSSSSISGNRWQQQQQQQQRGLDGAAVAWDSGPQGGFRPVGDSGGIFAARPSSALGGRDARYASDAASQKSLPVRPNSESGSIRGGRSVLGSAFRRDKGGVATASVGSRGSVVAEPAPNLGPPFLPLPGGVGTGGGSRFGGAGGGGAIKRPSLPLTVGNTDGWTSSSSSSSAASTPSGGARGRRLERRGESRSRSDASTSTGDASSDDDGDDGGPRFRLPSSSHAKFIPSSFRRSFEGEEEDTERALRRLSSSGGGGGGSGSSNASSSSAQEEEWSVVGSGTRWGKPAGESRPAGIKPAVGVHAAGWGGGGGRGNVGAAASHARGGFIGGKSFTGYNGTGGGGTAAEGLIRRRPTHRA